MKLKRKILFANALSNNLMDVRAEQLLLLSESILFETLKNRVSINVSMRFSHNVLEVLRQELRGYLP
jgi:hypothetical protein